MQSLDPEASCPECLRPLLDAGEELVCPNCGIVKTKETLDLGVVASSSEGTRALGSYLGSAHIATKERASRGISGGNSKYKYLKLLSDFAGRSEGAAEACDRIIQRVGEKLFLPRIVLAQASATAKSVLAFRPHGRRITVATVSAYALIMACKVEGVASASVREIVEAHLALGKKVTSSSIIQLALETPVRAYARRPEDYVSRVLARLSQSDEVLNLLASEGVSRTVYFHSLRETAMEVLRYGDQNEMAGKRPCSLAAAAIYSAELVLSCCESRRRRLTQRELARCGDTAEYTIREQCARIFTPAVERAVAQRKCRLLPPSAC
jgi:transcription initiation factor TFIIIB Brf1 subunit/transcription initiation factor TFIIB